MTIREGMTVRRTNRQALFFLGTLKVIERFKDTAQVENSDCERCWIAVSELEQVKGPVSSASDSVGDLAWLVLAAEDVER